LDQKTKDVEVTEEEKKELEKCFFSSKKNKDDCVRDYYKKYALKNGVEKTFLHLSKMQTFYKEFLESCHYLSHGIGHASLILNKGDVKKAFSIMSTGVFRNITTCGNGYFHGVIEEYARNVYSKQGLVNKLKNTCEEGSLSERGNCYHGVGHAALIQLDYNIEDSIYVCDGLAKEENYRFSCHTGVYMEYAQGFSDYYKVENGKMTFTLCEKQEKRLQPACYLEQSSAFEIFTKEPRNYTRNIGFCKQISDPVNRLSCIKLFGIRAIRISRYTDILNMCKNTSTDVEKVFCTAVVGSRIAGSTGSNFKSEKYQNIINLLCDTLSKSESIACKKIVYENPKSLFYTFSGDLDILK
jgi:hypothetical protein